MSIEITPQGVIVPSYSDLYLQNQSKVRGIYGQDIYIEPDSQDGQMLALWTLSQYESNLAMATVFNSFSPTYAQGVQLSSLVKINGMERHKSSNSSAPVRLVGVAGTIIRQGSVKDQDNGVWLLPDEVVIPRAGEIIVTAICEESGAFQAPIGSINKINTPELGWQEVSNVAPASVGAPVENDATLRQRQTRSTQMPALTVLGSLDGAIADLDGVIRSKIYENDTGQTDEDGLPPHSISAVVEGGLVREIAQTIGQRKAPGARTWGDQSGSYTDPTTGIIYTIYWHNLTLVPIWVRLRLLVGEGYLSTIGEAIKQRYADYFNARAIGEDIEYDRLYCIAFGSSEDSKTYQLISMEVSLDGLNWIQDYDIDVLFNQAASGDIENMIIELET